MSPNVKPLVLSHPDGAGSVHFRWNQDRFDHSIQIADQEVRCSGGSDKAAWPDSPPIQQVSIESIEGRDVALGVGSAGTSHWSFSIEPTADGFRFDWACRTKEAPLRLGTTYQGCRSIDFQPQVDSSVSTEGGETRIEPTGPLEGPGTYRWQYQVRVGEAADAVESLTRSSP